MARRMWLASSRKQGGDCRGPYTCIVAHGMRLWSSISQTVASYVVVVCGSRVVESRAGTAKVRTHVTLLTE